MRNVVLGRISEAEARIVIDTAERLTKTQAKKKQTLPLVDVKGCIVAISLPSYLAVPMAVYAHNGYDELLIGRFHKDATNYLNKDKSILREIASLYDVLKEKGMLGKISFFNDRGEEDEEALRRVCYAHIEEDVCGRTVEKRHPRLSEDANFRAVLAEASTSRVSEAEAQQIDTRVVISD